MVFLNDVNMIFFIMQMSLFFGSYKSKF